MAVSRRGVLVGALAGGGLALGYLLRPRTFPLPLKPGRDEIAFDAWLKIAGDGVVSVAVPQVEMGQGVSTLIPQIAAMELGADWRQIAVEPAPVSPHYANTVLAARWSELWMPLLPGAGDDPDGPITRRWAQDRSFSATADGTSLAAYEAPVREAAASVRALLCMAAAARWDVPWQECETRNGLVLHGENSASFASLATEAAAFDPPDPPELRPDPPAQDAQAEIEGGLLPFPRLDLPSKVDGTYQFAGDVRLPDMVYAAIQHGPVGDAVLKRYDKAAADGTPGFLSAVRGKRWLAAVGSNVWAAEQALAKMEPVFEGRDLAETHRIDAALDTALMESRSATLHSVGDPDEGAVAPYDHAARYDVEPALHATPETASATARITKGKLELWVGSQAPEEARRDAAEALGIDVRDVVLYPMPLGGSFDRRLETPHAVEAALIAKATGRPVQLVWSRWQEHLAAIPRTPVSALLAARTDADGLVTGWRARLAMPPSAREFGRRMFGGALSFQARADVAGKADRLAIEGALPIYAIRDVGIEHAPAAIPLPTGRMRANAHGYTAFFTESFIDELARKAGREPLSYRMALLGHDTRMAECLQRVAVLAGWDGGADNSGQGLACHVIGGGRIAVIASARRGERGLQVDRLSAVCDIGRIVNLDIARQQVEGGLLYGLGLATGSSTGYEGGLPTSQRLAHLGLPGLADCPKIDVEFVSSQEDPADPGELGTAAIAPALANALFSATGLRFRRLPLFSESLP